MNDGGRQRSREVYEDIKFDANKVGFIRKKTRPRIAERKLKK